MSTRDEMRNRLRTFMQTGGPWWNLRLNGDQAIDFAASERALADAQTAARDRDATIAELRGIVETLRQDAHDAQTAARLATERAERVERERDDNAWRANELQKTLDRIMGEQADRVKELEQIRNDLGGELDKLRETARQERDALRAELATLRGQALPGVGDGIAFGDPGESVRRGTIVEDAGNCWVVKVCVADGGGNWRVLKSDPPRWRRIAKPSGEG